MTEGQIVTFSFFEYHGIANKWWALKQMGDASSQLKRIGNLNFFKLLGSGNGNGFSIMPDFGVYGLLCVWDSYKHAEQALLETSVLRSMHKRSTHQLNVFLQPIKSKGSWDDLNPFHSEGVYEKGSPIAVLTRAKINFKKLGSFWKYVPKVSSKLKVFNKDIAFKKGIGELPLVQQATFSIWRNREQMTNYAYRNPSHVEMIRKTRELGWYSEEMFVEFKLKKISQNWPDFNISAINTAISDL